jgi:hypothetical protein
MDSGPRAWADAATPSETQAVMITIDRRPVTRAILRRFSSSTGLHEESHEIALRTR